ERGKVRLMQLLLPLPVGRGVAVPDKCPVAVPDKFSEQPEMFPAFMGECQVFMAMRPKDFPDDWAQVRFVISLLSGSAARGAIPLLVKNSPLLINYQGFWQHMCHMYEDPIQVHMAARHLKDLLPWEAPPARVYF
uniref:DUF4939 domain-containing protein n=1 Tax=Laticauda laticaudata TaxID=8630 RepID=A0A8C5SPP8_LATLA